MKMKYFTPEEDSAWTKDITIFLYKILYSEYMLYSKNKWIKT